METVLTRLAVPCEALVEGIALEEFDQIVRLYQRRIYRVLFLLLTDHEAADTLTQECFLRAYQKRASFRREASLQTWLLRIAVNLARDYRKNRRRAFWDRLARDTGARATEAAMRALQEPHASPERALLAREELATVWSAVERLSPHQRTIFLLRFAEEMSLEEISQAMKMEVGTVKSHLFRAIGSIRKRLKE